MQGLKHIIFDNTGTAKAASTFNLNIEAISEHVANCLKFDGPLAALAICKLKEPIITFLDDPTDLSNLINTTKWQRKYNHAHDQPKWWDENTQKIYNLVMQHSTPKMKTKLLTMDSWAATSAAQDGIGLLKIIRDICHKKDGGTNATTILDLVRMDKEMFLVHQGPTELLLSYLSKFKGPVNMVESLDGWFPLVPPGCRKNCIQQNLWLIGKVCIGQSKQLVQLPRSGDQGAASIPCRAILSWPQQQVSQGPQEKSPQRYAHGFGHCPPHLQQSPPACGPV
jgi:hypothetical protein